MSTNNFIMVEVKVASRFVFNYYFFKSVVNLANFSNKIDMLINSYE